MANKRLAIYLLVMALIILVIPITGCSLPGLNKDNASVARDIVLSDPDIKNDIATSGGSYSSEVHPADLNVTGYINYSGNFYQVTVNTANLGGNSFYVEHFDVLVDVESGREMQVSRVFDVAQYPEYILVPGHAAWYHRFPKSTQSWAGELPSAYVEINLSSLNASIRPLLMDEDNFNRLRQGMPFDAWSLYSLGENATEFNLYDHNTPIATSISYITAVPGRITMPGNPINGLGVKLTLKDTGRQYYYVLINDGSPDMSVESMIMG